MSTLSRLEEQSWMNRWTDNKSRKRNHLGIGLDQTSIFSLSLSLCFFLCKCVTNCRLNPISTPTNCRTTLSYELSDHDGRCASFSNKSVPVIEYFFVLQINCHTFSATTHKDGGCPSESWVAPLVMTKNRDDEMIHDETLLSLPLYIIPLVIHLSYCFNLVLLNFTCSFYL